MDQGSFTRRREFIVSSVATASFLSGCGDKVGENSTKPNVTKNANTISEDATATFQFQQNPRNTGITSEPLKRGEDGWSTQIGPVNDGLAISNECVIVGSGGVLHGLNSATGDRLWKADIGVAVGRTPAMTDTTAYVPVWNGTKRHPKGIVAMDLEDGSKYWRAIPEIGVSTAPTFADDTVYVGGGINSDEVIAIDATDGNVKWRFTAGKYAPSPAVVNGVLFAGGGDNSKAYALDAATGEKRWEATLVGETETAPTVRDNIVYIGTDKGYLYALSVENGSTLWRTQLGRSIVHSVAVSNDTIYSPVDSALIALERTGDTKWKVECKSRPSAPVIVNNSLIAADSDIFCLNIVDGNERWRHSVPDRSIDDMIFNGIRATPVVFDGSVYIASRGGLVSKLAEVKVD